MAIDDFAGLAQRSPALAGVLALLMLSLGGIPFTAGFVGKVGVFAAAIDGGYLWLAGRSAVGVDWLGCVAVRLRCR